MHAGESFQNNVDCDMLRPVGRFMTCLSMNLDGNASRYRSFLLRTGMFNVQQHVGLPKHNKLASLANLLPIPLLSQCKFRIYRNHTWHVVPSCIYCWVCPSRLPIPSMCDAVTPFSRCRRILSSCFSLGPLKRHQNNTLFAACPGRFPSRAREMSLAWQLHYTQVLFQISRHVTYVYKVVEEIKGKRNPPKKQRIIKGGSFQKRKSQVPFACASARPILYSEPKRHESTIKP